ncbi:MAG: 5'-nucleotidase C-terminal domain-containing protein [Candidatus Eremiobacterota bacterium]
MNISDIGKSMTSGKIEKKAAPKKKKEAEETKDSVQLGTSVATPETPTMAENKKVETGPKEKKSETRGKSKEGVNLKFIHMNDFHGYVEELDKPEELGIIGGITRVAGQIKDLQNQNPDGTITLDGGDIYDGGFYSKVTNGEIVSKPIGAMGFDASVIGNHDVTWGLDDYAAIAKDMKTDILGAANITDLSPGGDLKFMKPYKIVERQGVKIGILGLASPMTALSTPQKGLIEVGDPRQAAEGFVKKLRNEENVDMVVILSHLGHDEDVKIAEKVKGIDLIVGAHSHTAMHDAEKVGDSIIVQAGGEGKYVGDLNLVFDPSSKKVVSYKENLIPITADIKPDPTVTKIIAPYIEKYESVKNEVLGKTSENLELISNKRTNLCNLFVDAQKKDSDLAVTSSFSIRKGIEKGDVTTGKLFQMYPFDNELVQVKAKGSTVLKFLEGGLRFVEGDKDNYALVSGLSYEFNPTLLEGNRITSVTFKGKKMTPQEFAKKSITMSMDNYTYGKSYFKEGKMLQKYGRVFDVLKDSIK